MSRSASSANGILLHASSDDGCLDGLAALHPDPVRRPLDQRPRRRPPSVDLPGEIQEAQRTGRNAVEVDLGRELESNGVTAEVGALTRFRDSRIVV